MSSGGSSRVTEKKKQEGDVLMKEGDKLTTKTLFRWKPDWEAACTVYEKAGICYKNAKAYEQAKTAFKKAALCFQNSDISFSAGKNLDLAGSMAQQLKLNEEAAQLYEEASVCFREDQNTEKAAEELVKAAKVLEDTSVEEAVRYAKEACTLFEDEDRQQFAVSTFRYTCSLLLKNQLLDEALSMLDRQCIIHEALDQKHDVHKLYLSIVVIHLSREDYVGADKAYQDALPHADFVGSTEARVAGQLLDAFEKRSPESLSVTIKEQTFDFLDNQVVKIAKALKVTPGSSEEGLGLA